MPGRKLRQRGSNKLHLMQLGAAGWEITDGERVILLDPLSVAPAYHGSVRDVHHAVAAR